MEQLNCYLCGCPNYRVNSTLEESKNIASYCNAQSRYAQNIIKDGISILDCSNCTYPHKSSNIKKHFSRDWESIIGDVFC